MYKKNLKQAVERNKMYLTRKLNDGILLSASVHNNPYKNPEKRDQVWRDRECLILTDKEWIIKDCHDQMRIYSDIDDDTIPRSYPTLHVGESFYSAMLNGEVKFVGTASHTCSGAKPIIKSEKDLDKLEEANRYASRVKEYRPHVSA